jgi:hypothetical protein
MCGNGIVFSDFFDFSDFSDFSDLSEARRIGGVFRNLALTLKP